ncbi:MAG TPA: SCP2 sterol-binding domain-containing protein [Longimicrobiaceae bacterium]|nr:SCP2 sterol-binding domain-containing protein [Longimicrobiaceae bacterium]
MPEVFTEEWSRACCAALNGRESYRTAAAAWEGAIVLTLAADPAAGFGADRAVYIDAHHGECRGARMAGDDDLAAAPFVFRADPAIWKRLLAGEIDPVSAVMQGKLRLVRGGLMTVAKYATAAKEMIAAAAQVGGTFPTAPAPPPGS